MDNYKLTFENLPDAMKCEIHHRAECLFATTDGTRSYHRFDPLTNTITLYLGFNVEVDENFVDDFSFNSPFFKKLDTYYDAICSRVWPNVPRWDTRRPIMIAELNDTEPTDEDYEIGSELYLEFTTKWLVPADALDYILSAIADIDLMTSSGLLFGGIDGISDDAPAEDANYVSKFDAALYPLMRDSSKFYPINFRGGTLR